MTSTRSHFRRVLRLLGAMLAICAALSLLGSSGTVPFLCVVLAQISGEHQVLSGMDEKHLKVVLAHENPSKPHEHGFISILLVTFAEAETRENGDHALCFKKLRTSLCSACEVSVGEPGEKPLSIISGLESSRLATPRALYSRLEALRVPSTLAVRVVRCTILLI